MNQNDNEHPVVLIVDDDPNFRFLVRQTLEQSGYITEEAEDGAQAVGVYQELQPDIILLDVVMPEMDGFAVLQAIREMPKGLNVPIIMITSLKDTESVTKAFELGATDFLTKPVDWHLLSLRVQFLLRANHSVLQMVNKAVVGKTQPLTTLSREEKQDILKTDTLHHIQHLEKAVGTEVLHELLEIIGTSVNVVNDIDDQIKPSLRLIREKATPAIEDSVLLNMRLQEMQCNKSFVDTMLNSIQKELLQFHEKAGFYYRQNQISLLFLTTLQIKAVADFLGSARLSYLCNEILTIPGQQIETDVEPLLGEIHEEIDVVNNALDKEISTHEHSFEIE